MSLTLERKLSQIPSYSRELDLNLREPRDRFKWFIASMLFAKRISASIARKTYLLFEAEGLVTPDAIIRAGWDKLVEVLDAGGYVRYDFSTASTLLKTMGTLKKRGGLERLHDQVRDSQELEKRLQELKGVGPVAVNIFLRELRGIWPKARPEPSRLAREVGKCLGLKEVRRFESALVRLKLEYCKRRKCKACPVREHCKKRTTAASSGFKKSAGQHRRARI